MNITLVEDNPNTANMLVWGLRLSKNIVNLYTNAESCIKGLLEAKFTNKPLPDILITDYNLGEGLNGRELIRQIRGQENISYEELPIILISGASLSLAEISEQYTNIPTMQKPVTPGALLTKIREVKSSK